MQGKIHILARLENSEKHEIGIARVCVEVASDRRHKTDVIGVEVHRARPFACKDCHPPLTAKVVLPFRSVWMPMQFAQTTRLNGDQGRSDIFRHREVMRRSEEHTSELQSPDHLVCRLLLEKKKK